MVLLHHSEGIVGNSSAAIRECSFLGVQSINVGSRQRGRERADNVLDVGYDRDAIYKAATKQGGKKYRSSTIYGDGKAGKRIADTIASTELTFSKTFRL